MEPSGVPKETLKKARTMRAELLIQTNKMQIVKCVKVCHNVSLTLDTTVSSMQNIHVPAFATCCNSGHIEHCKVCRTQHRHLRTIKYVYTWGDWTIVWLYTANITRSIGCMPHMWSELTPCLSYKNKKKGRIVITMILHFNNTVY